MTAHGLAFLDLGGPLLRNGDGGRTVVQGLAALSRFAVGWSVGISHGQPHFSDERRQ